MLVIPCVLLVSLCAAGVARAEDLFDATRVFPLTYVGDMVESADITGDGLTDLVTAGIGVSVMIGAGDGSFTEVVETTEVSSPASMAVGDLNGDDLLDLALGEDYGDGEGLIRILLGNGDGTFYSNQTYATISNPVYLNLGDLDGDGDLDAVTTRRYGDQVVAHLNDGNGAFGTGLYSQVGDQPTDGVLEDFDGDGILDMALIHVASDDLHLCAGNGDGTFTDSRVFPFSTELRGIDAADLDGDGAPDLVVTTRSGSMHPDLHVLLGDGNGGFTIVQQSSIDGILGQIVLARIDQGPDTDIVVSSDGNIMLLSGNGDGSFAEGIESDVRVSGSERFTLSDLDGDGDLDLSCPMNSAEAGMSVALNSGDGSWRTPEPFGLYQDINWSLSSDLDRDGDLDVVMVHGCRDEKTPEVSALLNDGNGRFTSIEAWSRGGIHEGLHGTSGDLNEDGIPDLAVTFKNPGPYLLCGATLLGQGDGTFTASEDFAYEYDIFQLHLWMVDGDEHLDLVAVTEQGIWLCRGYGDGHFHMCTLVIDGDRSTLADAADLDGNGTLDMVVFNQSGGNFSVCFGTGGGWFDTPVEYATDRAWHSLGLGDLDGDGDPDLVYNISGLPLGTLGVRLNDGSGTFLDETVWSGPVNVGPCRLEDFDADGLLDVVSTNWASVSVHPGSGDGEFGEIQRFNTFGTPTKAPPAPGDFDGDGDLDLLVGRDGDTDPRGMLFRNTIRRGSLFAAGPGRGELNPSRVRTFTLAGTVQPVEQWQAYGADRWGVNVALGELDGSAGAEVLTGAGPGPIFGPHVRGFEDSGVPLPGVSFLAYGTNKWGVNVAAGDLDGDGYDEIVTGSGPGAVFGPHVRGWNWDGAGVSRPIPGISYFAYGTPKWGVNVSCGDIDGDGFDEIVTGVGPGAVYGPHVRGWNCDGGGAAAISAVSFLAYGTNKYGVNVTCGDIDGDGIDEMVTGPGPGAVFGPHVRGWNWDGSGAVQSIPAVSFFAFSSYDQWGANVSCGDLDGDGIDEILTGPGPGETYQPRLRGWNFDGTALAAMGAVDFLAFDPGEVTRGVKPAGLRAIRR